MRQKLNLLSIACLVALTALLSACVETLTKPTQAAPVNSSTENTANKTPDKSFDSKSVSVFASNSVDKECKKLVVETSISENMVGLTKFGGELAKIQVGNSIAAATKSGSSSNIQLNNDAVKNLLWYYSKNYVWLPMSAERMYGDKQHEGYADIVLPRNDKNAQAYLYADGLLKKVLTGVEEKHEYEFQVFILKQKGVNAISLPGGRIYLDHELVKNRKLQDRALFAIAHEISHVLQRHETKHIQTRLMDSIDLVDMVQKLKSIQSGGNGGLVVGSLLAGKQLFTRNYMDQEMQADSCGVKLTAKAMDGDKRRLSKTLNDFIKRLANADDEKIILANKDKNSAKQPLSDNTQASVKSLYQLVDKVSSPMDQHPATKERSDNLNAIYASLN